MHLGAFNVVVVVVVGHQIRAEAKTSWRTPSVRIWANAEIARPYFPISGLVEEHLETVSAKRRTRWEGKLEISRENHVLTNPFCSEVFSESDSERLPRH
jgi:hypothetical protein